MNRNRSNPLPKISNDIPPSLQASFLLPEDGGHLAVKKMHANRADGLSRNGSVSHMWPSSLEWRTWSGRMGRAFSAYVILRWRTQTSSFAETLHRCSS